MSAQLFTQLPPAQYWSVGHVTSLQRLVTHTPAMQFWFSEQRSGNVVQSSGLHSPVSGMQTKLAGHSATEHASTQVPALPAALT
jgi:hypothetical protein